MPLGVKWAGSFKDISGYGNVGRNFVASAHRAGIPSTIQNFSFNPVRADYGEEGVITNSLIDKPVDYRAKIMILTPEHFPIQKEVGKYNIGLTVCESDRVSSAWAHHINASLDECWTQSEHCVDAFLNSGVTIPIKNVKVGLNTGLITPDVIKPLPVNGHPQKAFLFGANAQWMERKNFKGLLRAYWAEFTGQEDVSLCIKTHGKDTSVTEQARIREEIRLLKEELTLPHFPRVLLIGRELDRNSILGLMKSFDCFCSPSKGEGTNLPLLEAMMLGVPCITTNWGGALDFATHDSCYLIDYQVDVVWGIKQDWVESSYHFVEPSTLQLMKAMRRAYSNREEAKAKAEIAFRRVHKEYSWEAQGKRFLKELNRIEKECL
jgi:glycosyltransferase involved in cell wall biosynthesis